MLINIYISIRQKKSLKKPNCETSWRTKEWMCVKFDFSSRSLRAPHSPSSASQSDEHFPHRRTRTKGLHKSDHRRSPLASLRQSATLPEITFNKAKLLSRGNCRVADEIGRNQRWPKKKIWTRCDGRVDMRENELNMAREELLRSDHKFTRWLSNQIFLDLAIAHKSPIVDLRRSFSLKRLLWWEASLKSVKSWSDATSDLIWFC